MLVISAYALLKRLHPPFTNRIRMSCLLLVVLAGASALDKRSAKAYKAAMLAKLGASAEKRPRIPAKMGLGMAKKAKQREAVALQEAIAAGMVKAKGRGKKERALKGGGFGCLCVCWVSRW